MGVLSVESLGAGWQRAIRWIGAAVAALGLIGVVLSFHKVREAVEPSFGSSAWLVPLGIDLGIAVFTGLDLLMARLNMRTRWLRFIPWALVAVTVYLNVSGETEMVGQVAHAAMPLLWVVAVEAAAHVVKVQAGLDDTEAMDRIRVSRWILAPISTVRLWRSMVLWEIRSYPQALVRRQDSMLAVGDMQDRWGPLAWRWRAPRRERILHRLGRLAPGHAVPDQRPDPVPLPAELPPPAQPKRGKGLGRPGSNGDVEAAARRIASRLMGEGKTVSRRAIQNGLRDEGYSVGTNRAADLARRVQTP